MTWRGFDYLDEVLASRGHAVGVLGVIQPALLRPVRRWLPDAGRTGQAGARDSPKHDRQWDHEHDRQRDHEHDRHSASPAPDARIRAGLARAEGDDELAREILQHMGMGLEPATVIHSRQLAADLGVAAEHAEQQQLAWSHSGDSSQGPSGTHLAAAAVTKELARRGWT